MVEDVYTWNRHNFDVEKIDAIKDLLITIKEFINRCRNSENEEGYLTNKFYNLYKNSKFKFNSGLFSNFVFKIINLQKNKINILLGNLKITTEKEKFIFKSI